MLPDMWFHAFFSWSKVGNFTGSVIWKPLWAILSSLHKGVFCWSVFILTTRYMFIICGNQLIILRTIVPWCWDTDYGLQCHKWQQEFMQSIYFVSCSVRLLCAFSIWLAHPCVHRCILVAGIYFRPTFFVWRACSYLWLQAANICNWVMWCFNIFTESKE